MGVYTSSRWSKPSCSSTASSSPESWSMCPVAARLSIASARSPSMSKRWPIRACPRFVQASTPSGRQTLTVTSARLCRSSWVRRAEVSRLTCTWSRRTSVPRRTPSTYCETLARLSATAWSETACVRIELSKMPPAAMIAALASRKARSSVTDRSVAARRLEPVPVRSRNGPRSRIGSAPKRLEPVGTRLRPVDLDLVFFGTSGSVPTAQRAPSALLLRRGGERLLFDCGEGTQRQLLRSAVGLPELPEVFVSHFHADHYLGLPGMLKTFSLRGRELPLSIYGPPGLRELFGALRRIFGRLTFDVELVELDPGETLERGEYALETFPVDHGVSAVGYALAEHPRPGRFDEDGATALGIPFGPERGTLQHGDPVTLPDGRTITPDAVLGPPRPGRRIAIAGDTAPTAAVIAAAHRADVLVHEATFCEDERERAHETLHSTAAEAAELARMADVILLALTHLSSRYFGHDVAREARAVFPDTVVPRDFDVIAVPFPERGAPQLVRSGARTRREPAADPAPVA